MERGTRLCEANPGRHPGQLADVAAETHVEDDAAPDISLDQNESGQAERPSECALVMIEFGWEQNFLLASVLKGPPRHSENGRRHATPGDFIGVPGVPGLGRREAQSLPFGLVKISGV